MRFGTSAPRPFDPSPRVRLCTTLGTRVAAQACSAAHGDVAVVSPHSSAPRDSRRASLFQARVTSFDPKDEPVSLHSEMCYYFQDLHGARLQTHLRTSFSAARPPAYHAVRRGPRAEAKRHPFSAAADSMGTLQHVSYRLPTSMATAPLSPSARRLHGLSALPSAT